MISHVVRQGHSANLDSLDKTLAIKITRAASKQTYYTVRYLVDRPLVDDAYRAYAYFRWVDDWLDQKHVAQSARTAFIKRQLELVECSYAKGHLPRINPKEHLVVDLIANDTESNSGLQAYIRHMLGVMFFDTYRRGRLISQHELNEYSHNLAVAVTEALHYFIGHGQSSPRNPARYLAATAAHITHMLRDTYEDMKAGYFNTPYEVLESNRIDVGDIESMPYRKWVRSRVELARSYFQAGQDYLSQVKNLRCRIAGYAYIARFEGVLDAIEQDNYRLRPNYSECKMGSSILKVLCVALARSIHYTSHQSALPHLS